MELAGAGGATAVRAALDVSDVHHAVDGIVSKDEKQATYLRRIKAASGTPDSSARSPGSAKGVDSWRKPAPWRDMAVRWDILSATFSTSAFASLLRQLPARGYGAVFAS